MSRKRKFMMGDVCLWNKPIDGADPIKSVTSFGVIVDYRQDGTGRGEYRVVRVLHPKNGGSYGEAVWVGPHYLVPIEGYPQRLHNVRMYRANQRLAERGCTCQCCPHEAIPKADINADGTFRWETE